MATPRNESITIDLDSTVISHESTPTAGVDSCSSCGSTRIARSQLETFDSLKGLVLGKQPYRCLHCYHRFWVLTKVGRVRKRIGYLLLFLLALALLAFFVSKSLNFNEPESSVSIIVPTPNANVLADSEQGEESQNSISSATVEGQASPSLASLINVPDQSAAPDQAIPTSQYEALNDDLSAEQQAELLLQAKQQSQVAEQASKARVEQLEQVLAPDSDELESLVKVEISYVVERWREAWANGDIDNYFRAYSESFVPANDVALSTWQSSRRSRVTPEKEISLKMSDFDITMTNGLNEAVIEFDQRYQSGSYIENSRKQLSLVKQAGEWKITREIELK